MTDTVVDSSVVAKWVVPEADTAQAQQLLTEVTRTGGRVVLLDLAYPEVTNAIWKQYYRGLATLESAAHARQVGCLSRPSTAQASRSAP